jgi:hypothetical protein
MANRHIHVRVAIDQDVPVYSNPSAVWRPQARYRFER